ncbi:anhydro-N-acetylmuramic acid kinase [Rhodoferax sp. TBRC 17660]|uniref:Anhydro-N-acetylmuramic acid kinase n=1 Tax=Rhodoferax potami TaxID=3068338 RepID=A0ABU3KKJ2_9BURK|nr:anhydro-N-acetylmuramic acid kinase [Rhodoferax sp. TBRC 17660]MDT7518304.1 anhydro-N-acetylmuramic acid kinase [Rhodoferax sp. TBRC 17660]
MSELFIGLMSGTSLDGVDGVLVDFGGDAPKVLAHETLGFPDTLRADFLALNTSGPDEIHRGALAANGLAHLYAKVVDSLLHSTGLTANAVHAIGAHGQTVRHRPGEFDGVGYTTQLNQPALLAELCGINVVADFRSRDVAAGGQGAPLVPPFHQAFFSPRGERLAVLNIGGISNFTLLNATPEAPVLGFDCGPGNALMDAWCHRHTGQHFDADGAWAASGTVLPELLNRLLQEPFLQKKPPKSTGRDLFNIAWLEGHLIAWRATGEDSTPADIQATLTEFTARTCVDALERNMAACPVVAVCGGGAYNGSLMRRLQALLPGCKVQSSASLGLPPLQVEATAFAWLARQTSLHRPSSLPKVTGAQGARILGAIYPA